MSVSFGFKKKIETKVIATETSNAEATDGDDVEFLKSVEDKVIQSTIKKEQPKELIIPLIRRNNYKVPAKVEATENGIKFDQTRPEQNKEEDDIDAAAAKELIAESVAFMDKVQDDTNDYEDYAVPLLMRNKVPDGFETDERLDVSLRPDEASESDYAAIPVQAFGMAVLRGMGWSKEEGIGRTFKKHVDVLEQQLRPKGLGLGANVPATSKLDKKGADKHVNNSSVDILTLKKGSYVLIENSQKYGTIEGLDPENARIIVKLAIGGKSAQVSQFVVTPVSEKEFKKNSKDISRTSKAYTEGRLAAIMGGTTIKTRDPSPPPGAVKMEKSRNGHSSKRRHDHGSSSEKSYGHEKHSKTREAEKHSKKKRRHEERVQSTWLRPHLRVRIIDKRFKKGKYFREKVIIEDVVELGRCSCRTSEGRILDDVTESMLETVIPRTDSESYVVIVRAERGSKHDGKLAKILEKDKSKSKALCQLIEDREKVVKLPFDEICEFTGNAEADSMF